MMGELSLNGQIRGINGALPLVLALRKHGIRKVILPSENRGEVELIRDMELYEAEHLNDVVHHLQGLDQLHRVERKDMDDFSHTLIDSSPEDDFSQVVGQEAAKRCVILACGGMHGLLLCGSPGVGKTMIASRIPTVLPQLTYSEMLEVTQIYSASGLMHQRGENLHRPPFRAPHYDASVAAMIGGGPNPKPGEVSLAHNGVLFLDEIPLFKTNVLESLRTPMEDGVIRVARRGGRYEFPSRFMLVAAANPCRCGYYGDPYRQCTCTTNQLEAYRQKMSGPFLDRMDLQIYLSAPAAEHRLKGFSDQREQRLSSLEMRHQIQKIRDRQAERYQNEHILYNSQLTPGLIEKYCALDREAKHNFGLYLQKFRISIRAQHKILRVSRTIADEADSDQIRWEHVAEALQYRSGWKREGERG